MTLITCNEKGHSILANKSFDFIVLTCCTCFISLNTPCILRGKNNHCTPFLYIRKLRPENYDFEEGKVFAISCCLVLSRRIYVRVLNPCFSVYKHLGFVEYSLCLEE